MYYCTSIACAGSVQCCQVSPDTVQTSQIIDQLTRAQEGTRKTSFPTESPEGRFARL